MFMYHENTVQNYDIEIYHEIPQNMEKAENQKMTLTNWKLRAG